MLMKRPTISRIFARKKTWSSFVTFHCKNQIEKEKVITENSPSKSSFIFKNLTMVWFIINTFYSNFRTWLTAKVFQLMLEVTTRSTPSRLTLLWGHLRFSTTLWTNTKFISINIDLFCPPWINATSPSTCSNF